MRIQFVRLEKGSFDFELLLAGLALAAIAGMAVVRLVPRQYLPVPRCTFHAVTGHPCLTCGGTRAATAISRLDLGRAFASNPLVALGLALAGPLAVWGLVARFLRLPRPRLECSARERRLLWAGMGLLAAANWAYLIAAGI
ncbi:MAG TPA: DUF2752 domain-containing protein [Planctomycetota bacterium]|nr:DUF2752 domain-containing protein [Planctomycetota bacterium]